MRTVTVNELDVMLNASMYKQHIKVEVKNSAGTWINLSDLEGHDWVYSVSIDCERSDQPISTATVQLRREGPHLTSMSPLMEASPVNILSAAYAPLLDVGTFIRISCCVVERDTSPTTAAYIPIFQGRIDQISWPTDPLTLNCSDDGAWLMDTQIETLAVYGSDTGVLLETVMQQILDATPSILGTVTLQVPVSPAWALHEYQQDRVKVLEALRTLASQIGWEVAFSWNDSHVFQLTLFEVDREKTTPDATIGPRQYKNISEVSLHLVNIRNVVKVPYFDVNGVAQDESSSDAASILKLGRRFMEIQESSTSNIDTAVEALTLAEAAVSDLAAPPITHSVEMPLFWPAEFGDLYRFEANDVHYDEDQDLAVVGVHHDWRDGEGSTTLSCAGKVRGAYRDWLRKELNRRDAERVYLTGTLTLSPTHGIITFTGGPQVQYQESGGAWTEATSPLNIARYTDTKSKTVNLRAFYVLGRDDMKTLPFVIPPVTPDDGGSGSTPPTLQTAVASENTAIGCGVNWILQIAWTTDAFDDDTYKTRIKSAGGAILVDDLTTNDSSTLYDTGDTGDPLSSGTMHNEQFTIEIVRRVDSEVMDSMVTNLMQVETGPAC